MARQTQAGPLDRAAQLAYAASQAARVGWYLGQYVLAARLGGPAVPKAERPADLRFPTTKEILADLRSLMERDWRNIQAGHYRMPHNLILPPGRTIGDAIRFFRDLPAVNRRRRGRRVSEPFDRRRGKTGLPRYYLQNFHYQTDGYLSDHSARLYDHQVEVLFAGGADAMRRQALVWLREWLVGRDMRTARLLDVAAGTGQFLTFVKDNHPRLDVTALDLSPNYLAEARRRLRPWSRFRVVLGQAETIPAADESFDLVTCIYLFHELPRAIRAEAAREIARVLKPGGRFIFIDSLQRGDRSDYDGLLTYFPMAFHEPYYADYTSQDLVALFTTAGLVERATEVVFMSKMMVFDKPAAP